MNNDITTWERIPTKTELAKAAAEIQGISHEVYVKFKALEEFVKAGLENFKKPALESFLKAQEGLTKGQILGATIMVIGESKTVKRSRYNYSEAVTAIQDKIDELEFNLKLEKENLKLQQTLEINRGIAKEEIFEDIEPEKLSLRVTLSK